MKQHIVIFGHSNRTRYITITMCTKQHRCEL